ncbi:TOM1-like protein 5 isoform X2 [Magnolia sinica]|uniref:TOM1-like protein 5 isoform X2 n=1 Tax=Magnolia sinica TaxID=86752 RepID=UPI0026584D6C|nr:TOM1-like protein 5 isoform X2 [Magnolia sinica]
MAAELVNSATSEKLKEIDWTKNIEICELVVREQGQARDVIKAIKKRLGNKNSNTQLFTVMLLEMLMNNCGEHIHRQVIEIGLLPILVKIVKKKTDLPVREKIFLLLDATQTSLGGASGKFPQYYAAYYDLVCAQVQFPRGPSVPSDRPTLKVDTNNSPAEKSVPIKREIQSEGVSHQSASQIVPDLSIIHKATSAMEVLREVLDNVNPQHPEGAMDEFTLDLVEQCSFQKQRVMHLVITSRDEKVVSQAIELNEQLQKVLTKHDTLLSAHSTSRATSFDHEEAEEEEADRLFRRIRKGKACAEDHSESLANSIRPVLGDKVHRPIIRPLSIEPLASSPPSVSIPPPPANHAERERFFNEKQVEGATLAGHMRGLSLHSRNGSSSCSGSIDFNEPMVP